MSSVTFDEWVREREPTTKRELASQPKFQDTETVSINNQFAATNPSCQRRHGNCNLSGAHNA